MKKESQNQTKQPSQIQTKQFSQNPMTQLSQTIYEKATSGRLTIHEAIDFLEKEAKVRNLGEKLEKFSHGRDLRQTLIAGLLANHPGMSKDSVERRVRGWLAKDSKRSVKKQDAIEICFILELSVEEADQLVSLISEEALHWRNPDEIVYIFALKQGMSYLEAQELNQSMEKLLAGVKETKELSEDSFTPIIRTEISALHSKEELADYLKHSVLRLGRYHNNAYKLFMEMLDILEHPRLDEEIQRAEVLETERLSIRDVLREYLYEQNVLYAKERARAEKKEKKENRGNVDDKGNRDEKDKESNRLVLSSIQESVAANWPDETTISKMKSRKMDVTRKVLILLFLATDSGLYQEDEDYEEYEVTEEEVFEDLHQRLNDMLLLCGFSTLDPRAPFDWLILYCICVQDMFDIDIRMKTMFKEMFGERQEEE